MAGSISDGQEVRSVEDSVAVAVPVRASVENLVAPTGNQPSTGGSLVVVVEHDHPASR
jgi:hypothetical protein